MNRPTTWEPSARPCDACPVQVVDARHYTSGKALVMEATPVVGGKYKALDYQKPGAPLSVRPLTPRELTGTSWNVKAYRVHKCEGRRP